MLVTRTLAGLALVFACGYAVLATVGIGWSIVGLLTALDNPDSIWAVPIVLTSTLAIAGVRHAAPALWRTRTGEDRTLAHRRFWLAWLAVLPLGALLYWVAFMQVAYTAMALPVAAVLLLGERYVRSRHDHSGSQTR
jgi:hypothetical protein